MILQKKNKKIKELDKLLEIWKELIINSHQNPLSNLLAVNIIFEVSRTNSVLQKWKGKETKNTRTFSNKFEVIQSVNYWNNRHVYSKTVKLHETIKLILQNSFRQGKDGKNCPLFFWIFHHLYIMRLTDAWIEIVDPKYCPSKLGVVFQDVIDKYVFESSFVYWGDQTWTKFAHPNERLRFWIELLC